MTKFVPVHIKDMDDYVPDDMYDEELLDDDPVEDLGTEIRKILEEVGFDNEDAVDRFIEHIDYTLPSETIMDAFRDFAESNQGLRDEIRMLYPVFIEAHSVMAVDPLVPVTKPKKDKPKIIGGREIFGKDKLAKYVKPDKRKLKKDDDIPQPISAGVMREKYVKKLQTGEGVECELCGSAIKPDEEQGWWLSIYPAHLSCVHKEMNRRANKSGSPLPFPDEE